MFLVVENYKQVEEIYVDPTTLIQPTTIYSANRYSRIVDIFRPQHTYPANYNLFCF